MSISFEKVLDAVDVETFVLCASEMEGKENAFRLVREMGLTDVDIVFLEYRGPGARVRVRGYINRPGAAYGWLQVEERRDLGEE